ncbi:hypothetical protein EZS27_032777, partial [termite gut metagenome]
MNDIAPPLNFLFSILLGRSPAGSGY